MAYGQNEHSCDPLIKYISSPINCTRKSNMSREMDRNDNVA